MHIGDFTNVPVAKDTVEGAGILECCGKKRRQSSFTVNATKEGGRTLIYYCDKKRR
jgi:hypothetical protein